MGSFNTLSQGLEVLAILRRGRFHPLKNKGGGGCKVFLRGGAKSFGPAIFPFCSRPPGGRLQYKNARMCVFGV